MILPNSPICCSRDRISRVIRSRPLSKGLSVFVTKMTRMGQVTTSGYSRAHDLVVYGAAYGAVIALAPRLRQSSQDGRRACAS
jgi:hypothetical protein